MTTQPATRPHEGDDLAVWPDGTWAALDEVWRGEFDWMSDDYEVVRHHDRDRQLALGIDPD